MVYPPVDTDFFHPDDVPAGAVRARSCPRWCPTSASTSRSTPAACAGVPLKIVGDGPERAALERAARRPTSTVPRPPVRRRGPRPVSARGRRAAAGRRRLRHRAARGAGVRPAGGRAGPRRRARDGRARRDRRARRRAGRRRRSPTPSRRRSTAASIAAPSAATPSGSAARGSATRSRRSSQTVALEDAPMIRHNRLLVAFHVVSDALLGLSRVHRRLRAAVPHRPHSDHQGPAAASASTSTSLPFIAVLVPLGFQLQGLYRLRRGRSRVDDFFAVFVGSILAVVFGIVATLYVQIYFADRRRARTPARSRCRSWSGRSSWS